MTKKVEGLIFCPINKCGSKGIDTGFSFWCTNPGCVNFKKNWNNSSVYEKECKCGKKIEACDDQCESCKKKNCPKPSKITSSMFDKLMVDDLEPNWGGD
jgi:hypothetical protein